MKYAAIFLLGVAIATVWNFATNRHVVGFVYYCGVAQGARIQIDEWQCHQLKNIMEWLP